MSQLIRQSMRFSAVFLFSAMALLVLKGQDSVGATEEESDSEQVDSAKQRRPFVVIPPISEGKDIVRRFVSSNAGELRNVDDAAAKSGGKWTWMRGNRQAVESTVVGEDRWYVKFLNDDGSPIAEGLCVGRDCHGAWTWYRRDRTQYVVYDSGVLNGPYSEVTSGGELAESGTYRQGVREGYCLAVAPSDDSPPATIFNRMVGGKQNGIALWVEDGQLTQRETCQGGQIDGWVVQYDSDGLPTRRVKYEAGQRVGDWQKLKTVPSQD